MAMGPEPTTNSPNAGGCAFATDPTLKATETTIFWTPATDPGMVALSAAPGAAHADGLTIDLQADVVREAAEGLYLRYASGHQRLAVLALGKPPPGRHLAAVVPLDERFPDRHEALLRFHQAMQRPPGPPDPRLTQLKRRNLRQMLHAVDGRLAGATYPQIAEAMFDAKRVRLASWKSLSLRDTVMRRVRDGLRLVNGGYRDLLRHRRAIDPRP